MSYIILFLCFLVSTSLGNFVSTDARAEITIDGSLSPAQSLSGPDFSIDAHLGQQQGNNLFHSFGKFNINTGESATFNGPQGINNIISRVTGGESSLINGFLQSTINGADFYFLNPAGIMFGENASLDIQGAFQISTADALKLGEQGVFSASTPNDSLLTVDPPSAFHFIKSSPGNISMDQSQLHTKLGETISLVGGNIELSNSNINAESGHINIVAVNSPGLVQIDGHQLDPQGFSQYGNIVISQDLEDQSLEGQSLEGQNLEDQAQDSSRVTIPSNQAIGDSLPPSGEPPLATGTSTGTPTGTPPDGPPPTNGEPPNDGSTPGNGVPPLPTDGPPDLPTDGPTDLPTDGPTDLPTDGPTDLPTDGPPSIGGEPSTPVNLDISGQGLGTIFIRGNQFIMQGSEINATTQGAGGDIRIDIDNHFSLDSARVTSNTESSEDGGNISIKAGNLSLVNGAAIQTETYGNGQGGSINIEVQDTLNIDGTTTLTLQGTDAQNPVTGLLSNAKEESGNGGNIQVTAGNIIMDNEGAIHALTFAAGRAGNISINTSNLEIKNRSNINTSSSYETAGSGDAGTINITASGFIKIEDQLEPGNLDEPSITGIISDTLDGAEGGGKIVITAAQLMMDINSQIAAKTFGKAPAGDISIQATEISLLNGATISNNNESGSTGAGGELTINASQILISGSNSTNASGLFSEAQGTQQGGNISINANNITLNQAGRISAKSSSTGNAGSIIINSTGDIIFDDGHIQTGADNAAGGFVELNAQNIHLFNQSSIDASVNSGIGGGGNILITGLTLVALDNSDFTAFAQQGWGGNIVLNAQAVLFSHDSDLNASSMIAGQDGSEQINSPEVDISATLLALPENFKDAQSILPESCTIRGQEDKSSFIIDLLSGTPSGYGKLLLFP